MIYEVMIYAPEIKNVYWSLCVNQARQLYRMRLSLTYTRLHDSIDQEVTAGTYGWQTDVALLINPMT